MSLAARRRMSTVRDHPSLRKASCAHERAQPMAANRRLVGWSVGLGATALIGGVAAGQGGYFPSTWGWTTVGLLWTAVIVLAIGAPRRPGTLEWVFVAGLLAFVAWEATSLLWTIADSASIRDVQRSLVYLAAALLGLSALRRGATRALLAGTLTGIVVVCAYALATRCFPERLGSFDPFAGYRLSEPLGYWNALAIFAAIGTLLALATAARARSLAARAAGGFALVLTITTLYFTFGRGGWVSLGIGLLVAIALDPRRLQLIAVGLATAPAAAVALFLATRSDALTTVTAALDDASRQGNRLAVWLLLAALLAAACAAGVALADQRYAAFRRLRTGFAAAASASAIGLLVFVFVHYGTPASLAERGWMAFKGPRFEVTGDLDARLHSFSGNGRADIYSVAWSVRTDKPILGSGAGTFERVWEANRLAAFNVRDAHSLYLETLSELGPIGLALLLVALAAPLAAAARTRSSPHVPIVAAGYAAYLVHAGFDWDWEVTAITLTALALGLALLTGARPRPEERMPIRTQGALIALALACLPLALLTALGGSALASAQATARDSKPAQAAVDARQAAGYWPWSAEPLLIEAEAELTAGEIEAAQATFARAVRKDPNNWLAWFGLARASDGATHDRALARARALNPLAPQLDSGSVVVAATADAEDT